MIALPIDPDFQHEREKVAEEEGIAVWGPVQPPEKLGIRGTNVAVDWDVCEGHGFCLMFVLCSYMSGETLLITRPRRRRRSQREKTNAYNALHVKLSAPFRP